MSAGQQPRKRYTSSSSMPPDHHHRSRPKRPRPDHHGSPALSLSSHVRLRWDGASRRAVPAQDQIGIPWSRLAPFLDSPPPPRHRASRLLADVATVPGEVFALENLRRVLSYEVWDKCLTQPDRKFLAQFLPIGTDIEDTVRSLLTAKNHHFGNPLLTWSSALCYGDLHPDAVVNKERQIRADKKEYLAQLNDYHSDMTEILTKWKEKWLTCDDPQSLFRDNPVKQKKRDLQSRAENVIPSKAPNNSTMPIKVVRNGDVTKFMSYIKITRSQHDLVKRMRQSGDGIQTKHLTGVLGDIDNFHVKPYETLMEDEKKKLHAYWAILSRKELPSAVEARLERKSMAENLRTSLCLEIAERSMPAEEEAEQVADRATYQNGGISDEQEEPVDHSPSDVAQAEDNSSPVPEDEDDNDTSDTDTSTDSHDSQNIADRDVNGTSDTGTSTDSHDSPNMSDQDAMDMNNTNVTTQSQSSADEQDQELEKISGNSSDRQNDDMEDTSCKDFNTGAEDDDMEDGSCIDTAPQDHKISDTQAQEPKPMNHTVSPIQGLESPNMLVQDCKNIGYAGFPFPGHGGLEEQTDDLKNLCYRSASAGHDNKKEMNHMVLDQRETGSITMMPSDNTLVFSKPLCEQNNVDEGPELNGHRKYQEVIRQSAGPMDCFYRPPGNSLYAQSAPLQLKHHLSGGPAAPMIDLGIDARLRHEAQITVAAALPMSNSASLLQPCTSQLTSEQLLNAAKSIGMVPPSYSVGQMNGLKQSVGLHSMTNGHLAQSGLVQEQMQLLDGSHNGLYSQQVENNMLYSGSALCTQDTFAMVEPQANFNGHAPVERSRSWFPNEQQQQQPSSHDNNWSGMESNGVVLGQDLPSGDGSLSSVLSQYKQVSSRVQPSSGQFLGRRNLVPPHGTQGVAGNMLPLSSQDMYGYTQNNMASSNPIPRSQADGRNLQWAQGGGPGMAHPSFRQFGGDPWSR
ncbi:unnamed protein product [Alopecurus aequalis]